jgi:uncharacterized protein YjlB
MKKTGVLGVAFSLMFLLSLVLFVSAEAAEKKMAKHDGAHMQMHHLHMLMNHGLAMVMEGANLVMLGEMKMTPAVDPMTIEHGRHMMKSGKAVIERVLSGKEMEGLHKAGHKDDPLMKYTHELGEAMLKVTASLEKMSMEGVAPADMMTMHHMHVMTNHALGMAAEGSNLIMLGQMGMAKDIDAYTIEHGKEMLSNARSMMTEVMEGKAMKDMHAAGVDMKNPMMAETHKIGETSMKIIDMLSRMSTAGSK